MSYTKPLLERERALEEAFFHEVNERLVAELKEHREHATRFDALAENLGLRKAEIIEPLLELGLRAENLAALVMAPLVELAWADRNLDNEERARLMRDESDLGIEPDSPAGRLFSSWLETRPDPRLMDAWAAYVTELCRILPEAERDRLREDIVSRARVLSGALEKTFLRGGRSNRAERNVLERIEATFDGPRTEAKSGRDRRYLLDDFVNSLT